MKSVIQFVCIVAGAILLPYIVLRCVLLTEDKPEEAEQSFPPGVPYSQDLGNLGHRIEGQVSRWISLPYTNMPLKCFGGKSNYNDELYYAIKCCATKPVIICPYGPVSRALDHDLWPYCVRVQIPLLKDKSCVCYDWDFGCAVRDKVVYESENGNTKVVLLTVVTDYETERKLRDEHRLAEEGLFAEELSGEKLDQNLFRPLDEGECIVVFDQRFIALRNKGETKFRGYRLE